MPISSVAMCVEGLLQKPYSSSPIPIGIALYHSLRANFNILLYSEQDKKTIDYWLSIEALYTHVATEYYEYQRDWMTPGHRKLDQLNSLRRKGYSIELVIDPEPEACALIVSNGFNVLNFIHSQYAMPQWRPDFNGDNRQWDVLKQTAIRMAEMKSIDQRLKEIDEENEWG